MAHTQGEWMIGKSEIFRPASSGSISPYYKQICSFVENGTQECKSNAKLIAAAPDLLEAGRLMIERFEGLVGLGEIKDKIAVDAMLKAIKKATA